MRLRNVAACICALAVCVAFAQKDKGGEYVQPTKKNIGVYKNEIREVYEEPIFKVGLEDRLLILKRGNNAYQVQDAQGRIGWIERRMVVVTGKSKTFIMGDAEVIGYLDNPTPVYIIDTYDPNSDPIKLDRSFEDALKENVDRETIERQAK
jgi:hypothetical protein